jgi:hypothetical protein
MKFVAIHRSDSGDCGVSGASETRVLREIAKCAGGDGDPGIRQPLGDFVIASEAVA